MDAISVGEGANITLDGSTVMAQQGSAFSVRGKTDVKVKGSHIQCRGGVLSNEPGTAKPTLKIIGSELRCEPLVVGEAEGEVSGTQVEGPPTAKAQEAIPAASVAPTQQNFDGTSPDACFLF